MVGWHHQFNRPEFQQVPGDGEDREAWRAAVHGLQRVRHDWVTEQQMLRSSHKIKRKTKPSNSHRIEAGDLPIAAYPPSPLLSSPLLFLSLPSSLSGPSSFLSILPDIHLPAPPRSGPCPGFSFRLQGSGPCPGFSFRLQDSSSRYLHSFLPHCLQSPCMKAIFSVRPPVSTMYDW